MSENNAGPSKNDPDFAPWALLKEHLERDALIFVAQSLRLTEVGNTIVQDQAPTVQKWITQGLITKPSTQQINLWNSEPKKYFCFLIVQPYVLIQEILQ